MDQKNKKSLTVALAVYNESRLIDACLSAIAHIADEIIIVDGGSTDDTVKLAKKYTSNIIVTDNPAIFHINKQKALDKSTGEWILQLDADEIVSPELASEILSITRSKDSQYQGYFIPRHNYFLGDWLRKGGQYPDYVIRLFRRGLGHFPQKSVHEQIVVDGRVGYITHALDHYSYDSISHYWRKAKSYILLEVTRLKKENRKSFFVLIVDYLILRPLGTFLKLYIRHKGFVDGWRGFLFAFFSSLHYPHILYFYVFGQKVVSKS